MPKLMLRFLLVGGLAAAAYLLAAVVVLEAIDSSSAYELAPGVRLAVNAGAFVLAALVAYFGLRSWVFGKTVPHRRALPRFLALAFACVALDEALFLALLWITPLSYQAALAVVLVAVGAFAFLAARGWVFAR